MLNALMFLWGLPTGRITLLALSAVGKYTGGNPKTLLPYGMCSTGIGPP